MKLQIRDIQKSFGEKQVLDQISFTFSEETINCIMGPSGSGKTTLGRILLGLLVPDSGEISDWPNRKNAVMFQDERLLERLNAVDNIQKILPRPPSSNLIREHLAFLGLLPEDLSKPVRFLSGGMRRRVELARAVMADADFILLDEPFSGLDKETRRLALSYVGAFQQGRMTVIITHDEKDVESLSANLLLLPAPKIRPGD